MLKLASEQLGLSPNTTMHIAEKLYLHGLITYPRTETNKYPNSFDIKKVLDDCKASDFKDYITNLLSEKS